MTGFPINPPRAPIADDQGRVSAEWYRFFVAIQKMIGGAVSPFDDDVLLTGAPAVPPPEADQILSLLPPVHVVEASDPLIPPVHVPPCDDLLYPPFYGVS